MKRLLTLLALTACIAGCSAVTDVKNGTPLTASQVQSDLQTIQPVASQLACDAQAAANIAQTTATELGDPKGTAESNLASIVAGTFCNGLAAGAILPVPVAVSGSTNVPLSGGSTVTLPVPAAAIKTSSTSAGVVKFDV